MSKSLFQTQEWAEFKCQTGYSSYRFIEDILILQKKLPLCRSLLYSPMISKRFSEWPIAPWLHHHLPEIKEIANKTKAIFYRLEFDIPEDHYDTSNLRRIGFKKSFEIMQPEHTLLLDITGTDEELLAQMKQKGRYNIKLAQKADVLITNSNVSGQELDDFFQLYEKTGKRQKITYRTRQYFETLLEILGKKGYVLAYSARLRNESAPLAAAIVCFYDDKATYLFGGSSDAHRNLKIPALLQWRIIQDARAAGFTKYDFFGIAPDDNEKHAWAGVTQFKKQFGGREVALLGSWDLVLKPAEYKLFKIAEKIRR